MDEVATSARQKAASAALFIFAFVGFIASIIAVVSYFSPTTGGVLRVQVTPNEFQVPLEVAAPFAEGQPARDMTKDMKDTFCTPPKKSESSKPAPSPSFDEALCEQGKDVDWVGRWANAFADSPGIFYRYEIENRGSAAAQQIRIAAEDVASLQLKRGEKSTDVPEDKSGVFYTIPDLNPHEKVVVFIWMTGSPYSSLDYVDPPKITFAGASVSTEIYHQVPEGWWVVYDSFGSMPTIFLAVFVVAAALLITLAFVLIASIVEALITGKSLRSVFQTKKPEADGEADRKTAEAA